VNRYLERARTSVLSCIGKNSTPLPPSGHAWQGAFEVTFVLRVDGRLERIAFVKPSGHGRYVEQCAVRRLESLRLSAPPAPVEGRYTF
jgi:hypothetical protein